MGDHASARAFLRGLENRLNKALPGPARMKEEIRTIRRAATDDPRMKHKRGSEHAFLNHFVVPVLFEYLSEHEGMGPDWTRQSLLSESYRNMRELASGTPARSQRHPFKKALGGSAKTVINQWKGEGGGSPLVQSCPDFALRPPCPHKIVFEGKYFDKGGPTKAETELVTDLYQAFFYLGLPRVPETSRHASWDYDYACLLAYDASPDGTLRGAWESLDARIKKGFWAGANIYVMIVRGSRE